jgi:hypothetical protein
MALPMWFLLVCSSAYQDKPFGPHVVPASYVAVGIISLIAAATSRWLAWYFFRPKGDVVFWIVDLAVATFVVVTFCVWWGLWIQEVREPGRP